MELLESSSMSRTPPAGGAAGSIVSSLTTGAGVRR